MRASDRTRFGAALLLLACFGLVGATRPAPEVRGGEADALREVRDSFDGALDARVDRWMRRAWRALEEGGWPQARLRADTLVVGQEWALEIRSGPRTRLGELALRGPDEEVIGIWRDAAGLDPGDALPPGRFDAILERGLLAVSDRGYPLASVTVVGQSRDPDTGLVRLTVLVRPGARARIRNILVEGATRTRPGVIARLSGLDTGDWVLESRLARARSRLLSRAGLVERVDEIEVLRVPGVPDEVDLRIRVEQAPGSGSFSGAVGARRGAEGDTELSGSVELSLSDLFGTARSFNGRWSDDGRGRNRLDLAWLEPMLLGSDLDLRAAVGQRHEDDGYDMVLADAGLILPAREGVQLGVTGGLDRTTFAGEEARTRRRTRVGVRVGIARRRGTGADLYGSLVSDFQAAFVSDRRRDPEGNQVVAASVRHSLIDARARLGWALSRLVAVEGRAAWQSTENAPLPLPRSEQWSVGGATSVRGHAEDRFFGERVAHGGIELVFGPARAGQAYLFVDAGWVRTTGEQAGGVVVDEQRLTGFGLGVRAPTALGAIDLGLGFADELNFDEGKLHVSLVQSF